MKSELSNRQDSPSNKETDNLQKRATDEVKDLPTSIDLSNKLEKLPKEVSEQTDFPHNIGLKKETESLPHEIGPKERPLGQIDRVPKEKDGDDDHKYDRPSGWRAGMRDQVWENARDDHGRVRDPVTGKYMSKDKPWDMGHKPGYEFKKHQESARERNIDREQFLDEYYNVDHYRPELPSSNRSHKGEDVTSNYFGD